MTIFWPKQFIASVSKFYVVGQKKVQKLKVNENKGKVVKKNIFGGCVMKTFKGFYCYFSEFLIFYNFSFKSKS